MRHDKDRTISFFDLGASLHAGLVHTPLDRIGRIVAYRSIIFWIGIARLLLELRETRWVRNSPWDEPGIYQLQRGDACASIANAIKQ